MKINWPHRWTRTHRQESKKERTLCEGYRALRDVRNWSMWLKKRPFSDQTDHDNHAGPYGQVIP